MMSVEMGTYSVAAGWLVLETNQHTCGGWMGPGHPHEPGCGLDPIAPVAELLDSIAERDRLRAEVARLQRIETAVEAWDEHWQMGTADVHAGAALHNALVRHGRSS